MKIEERFLNYVKFDTTSDPASETVPSTMKQKELARFLVDELHEMGIENAYMNDFGEVYAHIEANCDMKERIGFIAHMDTSSDCSGKDVCPRIIRDYDGSDIELNPRVILSPKEFKNLYRHLHQDLIVTDGNTLLGGDDKAGIAIIMSMAERIMEDESLKHGYIGMAFTCDEEIGRGADHFDLQAFHCDYAYTVDGGDINVIAYENFNACEAVVHVHGKSVHPGDAKGKMINASLAGMQFHMCLDPFKDPAITEGYEGFHHLTDFQGKCDEATLSYILRDHDEDKLAAMIKELENVRDFMNQRYGYEIIDLEIHEQYKNMRTYIEKDMRCIDKAVKALKECGLRGDSEAIRGGTDGAMLTYKGLNCPNLGTGSENCHGRYEYVSIQDMDVMTEVLIKIVSA